MLPSALYIMWPMHHEFEYCVKRFRKRNIYKKIQYSICCPVPSTPYDLSSTKFEVATSNRLGGDTFTRKCIIWSLTVTLVSRSHEMLPSTLYIMWPIQLQSFEVATFNGLGGDTFSRTVTYGRWTTLVQSWYTLFSKEKSGYKIWTNPSESIRIHHELKHVLNVQKLKKRLYPV